MCASRFSTARSLEPCSCGDWEAGCARRGSWRRPEPKCAKPPRKSRASGLVRPLGKLQAPKSRRRAQELHADTLALIAGIPEIHDPALQFLFGVRIGQHQHLALIDFVLEEE